MTAPSPNGPTAPPWFWIALAAGLILFAALFPYRHASENGFAYDDVVVIQENPRVQGLGQVDEIFTTEYWNKEFVESRLYRPVTLLSFAVEAELWGLDPSNLHRSNVILHAVVSLLVAGLAWLLLTRRHGAPDPDRASRVLAVLATGLLFAIHPLHTEAVAGLVGRAEILSALFSLALMIVVVLGGKWLWASSPLLFLALLSKESSTLVIPLVVLVYLFGLAPLPGPPASVGVASAPNVLPSRLRAMGRALLFMAPGGLAALALRISVLHDIPTPPLYFVDNPMIALPAGERLLTAATIFRRYLGLHLWPDRLSPDYSYHAVPLGREGAGEAVLGLLLLGAMIVVSTILLVRSMTRASSSGQNGWAPVLGFALAWYAGGVLAIGNFFFLISTFIAERLTYLPGIGFFLLVGLLIHEAVRYAGSERTRRVTQASIVVVLLALSAWAVPKCAERTRAWDSNETLFAQAVLDQPASHRVWAEFGGVRMSEGRLDEAVAALLQSRAIYPGFFKTHERLLTIYMDTGNIDSARVAAADLRALDPGNIKAYYAFARFHQADGHLDAALEELQAGIRADSTYLPFYLVAGEVYEAQGRIPEAIRAYLRVADAQPGLTALKVRLGPMLVAAKQWPRATSVYRDLCQADPNWSNLNYLSWCLVQSQPQNDTPGVTSTAELEEAIDLARRSIEASPPEMRHYPMDTYAQALWQAGRHEEAIAVLEDLVRSYPDQPQYGTRLGSYRAQAGAEGR